MTDIAVIHWLPDGLAGVAYIADNHPETDLPKYMRVKPCPECDGTGRCKEWRTMSKSERMVGCLVTCHHCKDGWVIA